MNNMKEQLKELGYWLEGKLKDLCGELTPDKRIVTILVMLLILTIGNLYFTFSTIYNWGKDSGKEKQMEIEIEHIRRLEQDMDEPHDLMDPEIEKELFDLHQQEIEQDSIDSLSINNEKLKEYE
ncbi:TraL conjugative transposon family protein [Dysgonomonas macrotermitis]|uniref:DUF3989 domain-containing protein n=1 Tax=Dysgonomonas macrotermitis TaxID=1346286 RepID=A0A1M5JQ49_9BACT|nr:TraL conjugative transposon family protein [Dysgonomonas macrotermitis]SHG42712.1 Protein of unknown function [Dysgonomonas macrotermitis]